MAAFLDKGRILAPPPDKKKDNSKLMLFLTNEDNMRLLLNQVDDCQLLLTKEYEQVSPADKKTTTTLFIAALAYKGR